MNPYFLAEKLQSLETEQRLLRESVAELASLVAEVREHLASPKKPKSKEA